MTMSTWRRLFLSFITLTVSLGLAACQVNGVQNVAAVELEAPTQQAATAEPENGISQAALPGAPIPQEEPLQFTFPTPAPPPVSLWRPPLYEVPWALSPHDHFYFTRPIAADEVNWPLADYRYGDYFTGTDIVHTGIDIPAKRGTPILAAADGVVTWAGWGLYRGTNDQDDPYGLAVAIRHSFGFDRRQLYTIYAHMDRVDVSVGQQVRAGEQLGVIGTTGFTTGPHLHFEVRVERNSYFVSRNPELWLAPPQGWGVLVGRLMKSDGSPIYRLDATVRSLDTRRTWGIRTYAPASVNSDDYYRENLVLSDLPAGNYTITFKYNENSFQYDFSISAGAVTYFSFRDRTGFSSTLPATPAAPIDYLPSADD